MSDNIQLVREWKMPGLGDIFIFGAKGSGKSCKLLTFAQALIEKGVKIWDIFGGERFEGPFWCFPNDDYNLWEDIRKETYEFKEAGPKQYKVNLLYPMFSKTLPEKLPEKLPHIKSKVFTMPISALNERCANFVIGSLGNQAQSLLKNLLDNLEKNSTGSDLEFFMNKKYRKLKRTAVWQLFLEPLIKNNFIASDNCDLNLDFIAEANQKDTVSVLCLDYVPEKYHFLVMGYFVNQIYTLVTKNKMHKRNFALFREASKFMKVMDEDKSKAEITNIFRNFIVNIVRYGRSGLFLGMDSQDSGEVKGMIDGQELLMCICEMPSQNSIEYTCKPLKQAKRMSMDQIRYIQWKIQKHQICIVERGKRAIILKRINPPRSKYWKPEYGNFESYWQKQYDVWTNTESLKDKIINEYKLRNEYLTIKYAEPEDIEEINIPEETDLLEIKESDNDIEDENNSEKEIEDKEEQEDDSEEENEDIEEVKSIAEELPNLNVFKEVKIKKIKKEIKNVAPIAQFD